MINSWQLRLAGVAGLTAVLTAPVLGAGVGAAAAPADQPFTVTNTYDSGPGSLRAAIESANETAGPDTIAFRLTMTWSKPFTITPLTPGQVGGALLPIPLTLPLIFRSLQA